MHDQFHLSTEVGLISQNMHLVFLVFHFYGTDLEVSLITTNMYHLELTPQSYKLRRIDLTNPQLKVLEYFQKSKRPENCSTYMPRLCN